jgi:hypothetical protein
MQSREKERGNENEFYYYQAQQQILLQHRETAFSTACFPFNRSDYGRVQFRKANKLRGSIQYAEPYEQ